MPELTRRSLLGYSSAMLGSFVIQDPMKLIVPDQSKEIVLATELPPEPLGWVHFSWAEVKVDYRPNAISQNYQGIPFEVQRDWVGVSIRGFAPLSGVNREKDFFGYATERPMDGIKVYFGKA